MPQLFLYDLLLTVMAELFRISGAMYISSLVSGWRGVIHINYMLDVDLLPIRWDIPVVLTILCATYSI